MQAYLDLGLAGLSCSPVCQFASLPGLLRYTGNWSVKTCLLVLPVLCGNFQSSRNASPQITEVAVMHASAKVPVKLVAVGKYVMQGTVESKIQYNLIDRIPLNSRTPAKFSRLLHQDFRCSTTKNSRSPNGTQVEVACEFQMSECDHVQAASLAVQPRKN